jgi:Tol biopolymer transport system component
MKRALVRIVTVQLCVVAPLLTACGNDGSNTESTTTTSTTATSTASPAEPAVDPFGRAGNGVVLASSSAGDIVAVDPASSATTLLVGGATDEAFPNVSPDGTRFSFERSGNGSATSLWVADIDGSNATEVMPSVAGLVWIEWAPDSRRIITVTSSGDATIRSVDTAETDEVGVPGVVKAGWLPSGRLLLVKADPPHGATFVTAEEDGTDLVKLATAEDATDEWSLAPDGLSFAYMSWTQGESEGRIHCFDLTTNEDTLLTPDGDGVVWEEPVYSPDGRWLKLDRFDDTATPLQVVLLAVDGSGATVLLGSPQAQYEGGTSAVFAPDSTGVIITYNATREVAVFDTPSGAPSATVWDEELTPGTWQRVAVP